MGIDCLAQPIPLCLSARAAASSRREHPVRRAPYRSRPMIQDVRVDHSHAQPLGQGMIAEPAHLGNARRTERYGDAESGQGGHPAPVAPSLGVGAARAGLAGQADPTVTEAAGVEEGEVHRRPAVDDPLRHQASRRGRVLEPVTAPADGEEEPLNTRRPAENRVVVRGEGPKPGPPSGDPRALDEGEAVDGLGDHVLHHPPVHRRRQVLAGIRTPSSRARRAKPAVTSAGPARH